MSESQPEFDFGGLSAEDIAPEFAIPKPVRESRVSLKRDKPKPPREKERIPRRKGMFIEPLEKVYVAAGMFIIPFDAVCGNAILSCAANCAKTGDELAYNNDAVRRVFWSLTQTSAGFAFFMANLPILMAIAIHHVPAAQNMMGEMGKKMAEKIAEQMEGMNGTPDA